jgi:anti-sigma regulatory factor (Ser/Thr protein kinase)
MLRATELGFDETVTGRIGLVVTEAGTNITKHGGGGEIIVGTSSGGGRVAVEIIALDQGPGIRDLGRGLTDGFSTSGTPGTGLGAIRRLSGVLDLHSDATGTALVARIWPANGAPASRRWRVGGISIPLEGEQVCGDAWGYTHDNGRAVFLVVDGLGHGRPAYDAAQDAMKSLRTSADRDGAGILESANHSARGTRGAAGAAADVDLANGMIRFTGIGNISGSVISRQGVSRSMISHHGVLGAFTRRPQPFQYPWDGSGVLVLHSDGLQTRWDLSKYPGLAARDPTTIAAVLYRDHARGRDDVTVVVATADPA